MRSVRSISWIWSRTVSRFSNTHDACGPSFTRRTFFSSMTRVRKRSRLVSYSARPSTSPRSISFISDLQGQPVSTREGLCRVDRLHLVLLEDAERGERTIGDHDLGLRV